LQPTEAPSAVLSEAETETLQGPPEEEPNKVKIDQLGHSLDSKKMSDAIGYLD